MGIDLHLDLYANYDYKNRTMPFFKSLRAVQTDLKIQKSEKKNMKLDHYSVHIGTGIGTRHSVYIILTAWW